MVAEKNRFWRLAGMQADDLADRMDEAEIEHLIGLVEDEDSILDRLQHAAASMVEQPAGRGDQDVDAGRWRDLVV
jgi:hypothetical protein